MDAVDIPTLWGFKVLPLPTSLFLPCSLPPCPLHLSLALPRRSLTPSHVAPLATFLQRSIRTRQTHGHQGKALCLQRHEDRLWKRNRPILLRQLWICALLRPRDDARSCFRQGECRVIPSAFPSLSAAIRAGYQRVWLG